MIEEKTKTGADSKKLITLSLCHMLKGETDTAMDYLFEARKMA